jgi:hypothetical protein
MGKIANRIAALAIKRAGKTPPPPRPTKAAQPWPHPNARFAFEDNLKQQLVAADFITNRTSDRSAAVMAEKLAQAQARLDAARNIRLFESPKPRLNHNGPNKPDKGDFNGSCNVTACQRPVANFYNKSTKRYYCVDCAREINWPGGWDDTRALYGTNLLCELVTSEVING